MPTFKLLGIAHLVGKIKFEHFFHFPLAECPQVPCQVVATPRQIRDLLDTPLSDNTVQQGYLLVSVLGNRMVTK